MRCHMSVRIRLLRPFRLTENHRCVGRKTEITVSSGELSDSIIVIVKKDIIEKLDVSLAALSLDGGEEQKVTAKLTPSDARMYRSAGKVPTRKLQPLTRTEI